MAGEIDTSIRIDGRRIGRGEKPYVIAELSANHNGSLDRARRLIDLAKSTGVDAVKIQTYRPDTITLDCDAEDFVNRGRPTYLVDYGPLKGDDRKVGIEHFVNDVIPIAIQKVSEDAGGRPVHILGWSLGGIMSLTTAAVHTELPIQSVTMVGSPFDFSKNPTLAPVRAIGKLTGGRLIGTGVKLAGSIPAPIVSIGFKATSLQIVVSEPAG